MKINRKKTSDSLSFAREVDATATTYLSYKNAEKDAAANAKVAGEKIRRMIAASKQAGKTKVLFGDKYTISVQERETTEFNEERFRKIVGEKVWNSITVTKLDAVLVKKAITAGKIRMRDYLKCVTKVPGASAVLVKPIKAK